MNQFLDIGNPNIPVYNKIEYNSNDLLVIFLGIITVTSVKVMLSEIEKKGNSNNKE